MLETEKAGPAEVPVGVRASWPRDHVPSMEETIAYMAPGEEKASVSSLRWCHSIEARPVAVKEQEWVKGGRGRGQTEFKCFSMCIYRHIS